MSAGADPEDPTEDGMTLLHHAIKIESDRTIRTLAERRTDLTQLLVDHEASLLRRWNGLTPLDAAVERQHSAAAALLAEALANDVTSDVIRKALLAALDEDVFPDWELPILVGFRRSDVQSTLDAWPFPSTDYSQPATPAREARDIIVNNVLNNLLGYPHGYRGPAFEEKFGVRESQVAEVLTIWRDDARGRSGGESFFSRIR